MIPADGTKQTHKAERGRCKACVLAVQYGMQAESLAAGVGCSVIEAKELLRLHRETYPKFWKWSETLVDEALLIGSLETVFGRRCRVEASPNTRSLANFPMQANGAEMLRLACSMLTEAGIKVCAPVHDAVLIEAPLDVLDEHIRMAREIMAEASRIVLDGFEVRMGVEIVRDPDRYMDERGEVMWQKIMAMIEEVERNEGDLTGATPAMTQVLVGDAGPSIGLSHIVGGT